MKKKLLRKGYSTSEKATIALEALKGNKTLNEITQKYGMHSTQINRWKNKLKTGILVFFQITRKKLIMNMSN